ncbi:MAG: hypothetical protein K9G24_08785 [Candidatus Nanopelagicales bacterium]|nr:hypothetical protein [Candidatus Nanopelagicales bacterium]
MREFGRYGAQAAYLVPTRTGLEKSIMDAHEAFRGYLLDHRVHDFSRQVQGPENKVTIEVQLLGADFASTARMSLYRPVTKSGDPRVWIAGLGKHATAGNLIAVLCNPEGSLFVVNVSDPAVWATRGVSGSPLNSALRTFSAVESVTAELLGKLEAISAQGFVRSLRSGPTGIGYTLETMLGIRANASTSPDYKGIEIKAGRSTSGKSLKKTRTSLFSQIPDWKRSPLRSGRALLDEVGYVDPPTGRLQLYCTNRNVPNPQGLYLTLDSSEEWLESRRQVRPDSDVLLVRWHMEKLRERLRTKHASTFWVSADVRVGSSGEEFRFTRVTHTRQPLVWNLGPAILAGAVTMDYTLSLKPTGRTRDHGYLFKLHEDDIDVLFPPSVTFDLAAP